MDVTNNYAEPRVSRYLHAKAAKLGIPVSGTFELTGRCNLSCKMCYVHDNKVSAESELSADEWLAIARDAKKEGLLFLLLTGGEPLLRRDFGYIYRELTGMGFVISVNTNAALVTPEHIELFRELPPVRINVSLYGTSEDTYEKLCGFRRFGAVRENILALRAAGMPLKLNLTANRYNIADVPGIYEFAHENGIPVNPTAYLFPPVRADNAASQYECRFSPDEAADAMVQIRGLSYLPEELKARADSLISLKTDPECGGGDELPAEGMRCRAGRSCFWLTHDGKMNACGMMDVPSCDLRQMSFRDAWASIRESVEKIRLPVKCANCPDRDNCGVCAAICYTETGSTERAPEYMCRLTQDFAGKFMKAFGGKQDETEA